MSIFRRKQRRPIVPPPSPSGWSLEYSPGCSLLSPPGALFAVDIPRCDTDPNLQEHLTLPSLHYMTRPALQARPGQTFRIRFGLEVPAGAEVIPTQGEPPGRLRPYFQRQGDTMSGVGLERDYRFWGPYIDLRQGEFVLEAVLAHDVWSSVYPHDDDEWGFADALANAGKMGMTCGGMFAGHGVVTRGGVARLTVYEFGVV